MSDIMTFIVNPEAAEKDPEGNLLDLGEWSEAAAKRLATEEGIELTDKHWEIIRFLREHYKEHGESRSARKLLDVLAEKYETDGGRKYLYLLFPKGPVSQGCKIAGLPLPEYSQDRSFGTAV
jgi:TusE/DsrC/DsvC family sulfur relay protein